MNIRKYLFLIIVAICSIQFTYANNKFAVPMQNIGFGTYYVSVQLADMANSKFMVDTGSGYVAINQASLDALKQNKQAKYLRDIKGVMANGKSYIVPIWQVSSLTLNNECTLKNVEVAVFPGKTRQILGLSALKKAAPLEISFDPPQLVLGSCDTI